MPNKNYIRGARFERSIAEELEQQDYVTLRTAGSHGFADVVAIHDQIIRLIQSKTTKSKVSLKIYKSDIKKIIQTKCPPNCTRELWIKEDRKEPYKVLIL